PLTICLIIPQCVLPLPMYAFCVLASSPTPRSNFFFFNDTATTEIYTLSLHDALPICRGRLEENFPAQIGNAIDMGPLHVYSITEDRKSTRLNSSHVAISYAVFCLKKKKDKES